MREATALLGRIESVIQRLESITQKAEEDRAWSSAVAAIWEIRGCLTLLAQLTGDLQSHGSTNISVSIVSQRIQACGLAASPGEFAQFWKELLEKAEKRRTRRNTSRRPFGLVGAHR